MNLELLKNLPTINHIRNSLKYLKLFLVLLIVLNLALLSVLLLQILKPYSIDSPNSVIESSRIPKERAFEYLRENIRNTLSKEGIERSLEVVKNSLQRGDINLNQCHIIIHLIGHEAYSRYPNDLKKLAELDLLLCGHAYQHGIEAEIALDLADYKEKLYKLCELILDKHKGITCYHGSGHAFMHSLLDVTEALKKCDSLSDGPTNNLSDCYNGVFSEYAFQIDGVDGDTGLPIPGGPRVKLEETHVLDFCQSLPTKYQISCGSQLSRIILSTNTENALKACVEERFLLTLQASCIRIVSAVIAQREFSTQGTVKVAQDILSYPDEIRLEYIRGIAGEYWALTNSGIKKDWRAICNSFKVGADILFCEKMMEGKLDDSKIAG